LTFLVGQNGVGWTQVTQTLAHPLAGDTAYYQVAGSYAAVSSGNMTLAHFGFFDNGGTGNNAKVCVYQGGSLIAVSSPIAKAAGDQSATISGSISAGLVYTLVMVPDTGRFNAISNSGSSSFQVSGNTAANFSYASPPATLPAKDYNSTGQEFLIWIEGTTGPVPGPPNMDYAYQPTVAQ
jgi:hypothetical protein